MDVPPEHKLLDIMQHLGAYFGGVVAVLGAGVGFWWRDRVSTRALIDKNMSVVLHELKDMREEIKEDAKDARVEAAENLKRNHDAHADILETINDLNTKTNNKIMSLHAK